MINSKAAKQRLKPAVSTYTKTMREQTKPTLRADKRITHKHVTKEVLDRVVRRVKKL